MTVRRRQAVTAEELHWVEDALRRAVASDVELLSRASEYMISSGGKRIRPQLVLLAYKAAGGGDVSRAIPVAASTELLHTASLIHDDINDRSDIRRGRASVNALYDDRLALLIGDFVFIRLLGLMADFGSRVIQILADACRDIIEGETLQMLNLHNLEMTEDAYLRIVTQKTASLFSACAALGGVLAGASDQETEALGEYGLDLGIAFQIRDDTLDLVGDRDKLGKPVANDLEEGKLSLATLCALHTSDEAREALLRRDFAEVVRVLRRIGALDYAMQRAKEYVDRAKSALTVVPSSEAKAALCDLAAFVVARDA